MTGTTFTKRTLFSASTTIEDGYCEIRPGAMLVTGGPNVRVTINAPLSIAQKWMQCFDTSRGGYFLVGPRGMVDEFTSAMFGAFGDGMSTAALRALIAICFGAPDNPNGVNNARLNRYAKIGPGDFLLDDTLELPHLAGASFSGYGELGTRFIQTKANTSAIRTTSLAYSDLSNFYVTSTATQDESVALLDLDCDDTPGTASLQNNRVSRVYLDCAGRSAHGLWYGRSNRMGSETLFDQCYFIGATRAAYRQDSWNALANRIEGCNFSGNQKDSIRVNLGSCHVLWNSFQNQGGDGWDIVLGQGSSVSCVYGNRTESLKHCYAGPYNVIDQRASMVVPAVQRWAPNTTYAAGTLLTGSDAVGDGKLYRASGGTTGASEPSWSDGLTDGTTTWQHVEFDVISTRAGSVAVSVLPLGRIDCAAYNLPLRVENIVTSRVDWMQRQAYALSESSLITMGVHVLKGAMGPATDAPLAGYRPTEVGAIKESCCRARVLNFGSYSLLFSAGDTGHVMPDVGIERAHDQLATIGTTPL